MKTSLQPNRCQCPACKGLAGLGTPEHPDRLLHQQINLLMSAVN